MKIDEQEKMQSRFKTNHLLLAWALTVALHALLLEAYGFAKCIFIDRTAAGANCTGNSITNLSSAIHQLPNQTSWLDASDNLIKILESETFFHLSSLLELRLVSNKIDVIPVGAFANLEALRFLDLSHNQIISLDPSVFAQLRGLRVLNVSNNYLPSIDASSLKPLFSLQELDLSSNHISEFWVVAQATKTLTELWKLNVKSNYISDMRSGQKYIIFPNIKNLSLANNTIAFFDLTNYLLPGLLYLDLTRNNMTGVNASSFHNARNLVELLFDQNPLNVSQILGIPLPNLTALHLSSLRPALGEDLHSACQLLQSFPKLTLLDIEHSKIKAKSLGVIGHCSNLTYLDLSTTPLNQLRVGAFRSYEFLETLNLGKCKVTMVSPGTFDNLTFLHTLVLERNQLQTLEELAFKGLANLHSLDLSKNYLTHLSGQTFLGLNRLTRLNLSNCKLVTVTQDTFMCTCQLTFLDLSHNSLTLIKDNTFKNVTKLESLLLNGNRISALKTNAFRGLSSLRYLSLSGNGLYKLDPNRFAPLRGLNWLDLSRNQLTSYNKYQKPSPFMKLKSLKTLDLSYQERSSTMGISSDLFVGLRSLEFLNIRGYPSMLFPYLSFEPLINLKELDMSDIYPSGQFHLNSDLLQSTGKLRNLKLESNSFTNLPEYAFANLTSLENLSLRDNTLTNISKTLLGNLTSLAYLDVTLNPLLCTCENFWFQNWSINDPHVQVPLVRSFSCSDKLQDKITFAETDLSFCNNDIAMICFICTFTFTLLTMLGCILAVKLRWILIYSYCMLRAWCENKFRKEVRAHQYDAFVSCCADDELWVMDNILYHLETQGQHKYKLCFRPRDFLPGEFYIDSVQKAINNSRKTICVVSSEYLNSDWCRLEIEMACSRMFYQREDVLIVVFLEDIPNYRLSTFHRLRKLLRHKAYITLPEDPAQMERFWSKLRTELDSEKTEERDMHLAIII